MDIAGFWRRIGAFAIDGVVLGVIGLILGAFLYDTFANWGVYGRLLGFLIALAYFAPCNSGLLNGQTLGKKLLGLRVVHVDGRPISLLESALRFIVLSVPFFLNGAALTQTGTAPWVFYLLSFVVFGVGFSIVYLYVFNRATRQSLHDLVVGSYVVRIKDREDIRPIVPIWSGHWVVVALLMTASLGAPKVTERLALTQTFADLLPAYESLSGQPHVANASVMKSWVSMNGNSAHYVVASLRLDSPRVNDKALAKSTALVIAREYPAFASQDAVIIQLAYGYDIGIASSWQKQSYSFKPAELR